MSYTEIQRKGSKKYYYRVRSIKMKGKVTKKRVYLGENIEKNKLRESEKEADKILNKSLNSLLSDSERKGLEQIKKEYKTIPQETFENRYETFLAKFTCDSNAIEGNTLDLKETSYILFENRTPKGKSLREINEVLNHKEAFDFVLNYKKDITKEFMCEIQKKIVKNTLRKDLENQIGKYRIVQVYIRGADFIPSTPEELPMEMRNLLRWYTLNKNFLHPLILAAYFHAAFEAIHPFVDGNGRTGRLLLNFILSKNAFPMLVIPNKRKLEYYDCLEQAQQKNNLKPFIKFLYELLIKEQKYI
ncbi:MAG: Fic family protein [bacterium]|nr:Fic family protein [bacterium]